MSLGVKVWVNTDAQKYPVDQGGDPCGGIGGRKRSTNLAALLGCDDKSLKCATKFDVVSGDPHADRRISRCFSRDLEGQSREGLVGCQA
ncbi:hypothetical protein SAMN05428997_112158 [Bosea sp. CRIB-10]|nr:hypothetical protein SAMN05428997_112158 [Bosea sp. CRIB-10]